MVNDNNNASRNYEVDIIQKVAINIPVKTLLQEGHSRCIPGQ